MRPLLIALLFAPHVAKAENIVDVDLGVGVPASDDDWTDTIDPSFKIGAGFGVLNHSGLGAMLRADWTRATFDDEGGSFGFGSADVDGQRFRIIASAIFRQRVSSLVDLSARLGGGLDIANASAQVTVLGTRRESSDTDVGPAIELGVGAWFHVTDAVRVGGEFAVPIGFHDKQGDGSDGNYTFDYTSIDLDFLFGVRFTN